MSCSKKFSEFAANLEYEDLPKDVVKRAELCVLDFVACAFGGYHSNTAKQIITFVKDFGGRAESTIVVDGARVPSPHAALANASFAHTLDFDDVIHGSGTHAAAIVVPAALAVAERERASGQELLTAIIIGYEIFHRLNASFMLSMQWDRGMHNNSWGTHGAAMSAGKLLKFSQNDFERAFGLCGLAPISPFEAFMRGSQVKDLHAGWPAMTGIYAALMSKSGFDGSLDTLIEGNYGMANNVTETHESGYLTISEKLVQGLGTEYPSLGRYHLFKLFPACTMTHEFIYSALTMTNEHSFSPEQIDQIVVRGPSVPYLLGGGVEYEPKNHIAAEISVPYLVAAALIKRRFGVDELSEETLKNPEILALAKKVDLELYPEQIMKGLKLLNVDNVVEITLKTGERYVHAIPRGEKTGDKFSLGSSELEAKFRYLARPLLRVEQIEETIKLIHTLHQLDDINELTSTVTIDRSQESKK